mgnify:CR=1 FL=1
MRPEYRFTDNLLNNSQYLWGHIEKVNGNDYKFNSEDLVSIPEDKDILRMMKEDTTYLLKKLNKLFI